MPNKKILVIASARPWIFHACLRQNGLTENDVALMCNETAKGTFECVVATWQGKCTWAQIPALLGSVRKEKYDQIYLLYGNETGKGYFVLNVLAALIRAKKRTVVFPDFSTERIRQRVFGIWNIILRPYWDLWLVFCQSIVLVLSFIGVLALSVLLKAMVVVGLLPRNSEKARNTSLPVSVLMIARFFYPQLKTGTLRSNKFAKFLPEFGYKPIVITAKWDPEMADFSLEDEMRGIERIYLKPEAKVYPFLNFPDRWGSWIPRAVTAGIFQALKTKAAIVYSSAKPWSDHVIAWWIGFALGLPVVLDYRDEWTITPFNDRLHGRMGSWLEERLEDFLLRSASAVITVTPSQRDDYRRRFHHVADKVFSIRNGFDPSDFPVLPLRGDPQRVIFTFVGGISAIRTVRYLADAFSHFFTNDPQARDLVELRFVGWIHQGQQQILKDFGIWQNVRIEGPSPYAKALEQMASADILVSITSAQCGTCFASKTYEYLYANKPVLALVPRGGEVAQIVEKYNLGVSVDPMDASAIYLGIEQLYRQALLLKQKARGYLMSGDLFEAFHRRSLTGELATIFDAILLRSSANGHHLMSKETIDQTTRPALVNCQAATHPASANP